MKYVIALCLLSAGCAGPRLQACFSKFADNGAYVGCDSPGCDCRIAGGPGQCGDSATNSACTCNGLKVIDLNPEGE